MKPNPRPTEVIEGGEGARPPSSPLVTEYRVSAKRPQGLLPAETPKPKRAKNRKKKKKEKKRRKH